MLRLGLRTGILGLMLASASASAEPRTWTFGAIAPDQSVFADLGNALIDRLEKNLHGDVKIKRRQGGLLGDELSTAKMCQEGRLELWGGSLGAMMSIVPELRSLELPFLFKDLAALQRTMRKIKRGHIAKMQAVFEQRGLLIVTIGGVGWRNISSTDRPIRTVDDLKGLRARSQPADVHLAMWRAFGASPKATSLNELAEVYDAERLQVLDVPASFLYATSLDAKIRHHTLTQHMPQLAIMVVNKAAWESLSKERRAHFADGLEEVASKGELAGERFDEELHGMLAKRGVGIIRPSAGELDRFRAASSSVATELKRTAGKTERDLIKEIEKALGPSR